MRILTVAIHPDVTLIQDPITVKRLSTRAIVQKDDQILLMYTKRYEDYSLPGGGLDNEEPILEGCTRELIEETGAQNVRNLQPYGIYEEYRPWYRDNANVMNMISYCFTCEIDDELGTPELESHEINNGMVPMWVNIHDAIAHNEDILAHSDKQGLSIIRETYLLKHIASHQK
ncbi:NUDIX domain-containing protein [Vibrio sp.]|nr:NUDIX domain-containing protein [Vibrio sp.]